MIQKSSKSRQIKVKSVVTKFEKTQWFRNTKNREKLSWKVIHQKSVNRHSSMSSKVFQTDNHRLQDTKTATFSLLRRKFLGAIFIFIILAFWPIFCVEKLYFFGNFDILFMQHGNLLWTVATMGPVIQKATWTIKLLKKARVNYGNYKQATHFCMSMPKW